MIATLEISRMRNRRILYSKKHHFIAWLGLSLCLALLYGALNDTGRDFIIGTLLYLTLLGMAVFLLVEANFTYGTYNENGIFFRSFWKKPRREKWKNLIKTKIIGYTGFICLEFQDGEKIHLSLALPESFIISAFLRHRNENF